MTMIMNFLKYLQEVPELLIETCPIVTTMTSFQRHSFALSHRENDVREGMLMLMNPDNQVGHT